MRTAKYLFAVVLGFMSAEALAARSLTVGQITESSVTLSFGASDEKSYGLYLAHGSSDAGEDKGAWDGFEKVSEISADQTTLVYEVPEELRDGRFLRFFLLQSSGVQYAKEFKSIKSTGAQWIDVGIPPTSSWIVDFRFGNVEVANDKAMWGRNWSGKQYLLSKYICMIPLPKKQICLQTNYRVNPLI